MPFPKGKGFKLRQFPPLLIINPSCDSYCDAEDTTHE